MLSQLGRPFAALGRYTLQALATIGRSGALFMGAVRALRKVDIWGPLVMPQLSRVGVQSVPIGLFIAAFTGVVLALQASYTFTETVPTYFVGSLVEESMILELGPVLVGLVLAGRVGASIAAELGTMRVTEQIDALETLAYDPVAFLVVPRVLAGILMFPIVVALAIGVGIGAGWFTSLQLLDMSSPEFLKGARLFFDPFNVRFAMIKSMSFGATVTGVGCFFGFSTSGGAAGVGKATTTAVVMGCMIILVLDAFWAATLLSPK